MSGLRNLHILIICAYVVLVTVAVFISDGILEPGDGISHYQYARYAVEDPLLYLSHWAKPLFTLLSSPFAQLGFHGMVVFNLTLSILLMFYLRKLALFKFDFQYPWTVVLFTFCAPVFFGVLIGGLTEILFAFLLVLGLWLILSEKFIHGAVLLSFLPYARPEAYVVLPFIAAYLAYRRPMSIPFLAVGTVIYSAIGYIVLDDWLWYYHQDPYLHKEPGRYGSGSLFRFVRQIKNITGWPIAVLFLSGSVFGVIGLRRNPSPKSIALVLLFILPALAVFFVHSYLWWKGLNGSYGLIRVITTVVPLIAFVTGYGLEQILDKFRSRAYELAFLSSISILVLIFFLDRAKFNVEFSEKERYAIEAASWASDRYSDVRVHYLDPLIVFEMEKNPFDESQSRKIWSMDKEVPSNSMRTGDILIWDSHFGPQEGRMPLSAPMNDNGLELKKSWKPEPPIIVFSSREYEIHLFEKK